jgi:hypothetical protein
MSNKALFEDKVGMADQVIDRYVNDDSCEAVYLSGSLAAGLGTPYSDVDVFVITPAAGRPGEDGSVVQHGNGLDRVDVEFRTAGWLDEMMALGRAYTSTVDDNQALRTPERRIEDAIRLKLGHVVKSSPRLDEARQVLAAGEGNLRKLVIAHLAAELGGYWMDALGFQCQRDAESMEVISRSILAAALDAACVSGGDLCRGEKWIWSRVRRCELLRDAQPWLRGLFVDSAGGHVTRMLAAQKVLAWAILCEWGQGEVSMLRPPGDRQGDGLTRSPHWMLTRMADSAILTDRDQRHYAVPDLAVACWAAADGLPRPELETSISQIFPAAASPAIAAALAGLEKIGAVGPATAWS